jgi:hypothetical protein
MRSVGTVLLSSVLRVTVLLSVSCCHYLWKLVIALLNLSLCMFCSYVSGDECMIVCAPGGNVAWLFPDSCNRINYLQQSNPDPDRLKRTTLVLQFNKIRAMQRRIRFAGGSDGPEILPRSSQSGSRPSRSDRSGMIK